MENDTVRNNLNSENIAVLNSFVARACGEEEVKVIKDGFGYFCTVKRTHGRIDYNPWCRIEEAAKVMMQLKIGVEPMFDEGKTSWKAWVTPDGTRYSEISLNEAVCRAALSTIKDELYDEAHKLLNRIGKLIKESEQQILEKQNVK